MLVPENKKYRFHCHVHSRKVGFEDIQGKGKKQEVKTQTEADLIFLVPDDSSEADRFLAAWLPDTDDETFEILLQMPRPVYGMCRVAIRRASQWMPRPHLQVMSLGAETRLLSYLSENKEARIEVVSQPSEAEEEIEDPE